MSINITSEIFLKTGKVILATLILAFTGCTVAPKVQYNKITKAEDVTGKEFDAFALQRSFIQITLSDDGSTLVAKSIPTEYTDFKLGVIHADSWGVSTNLNIAKVANTDLIQEAGVEVSDQRVELIGKVGSVITKIAGNILLSEPGEKKAKFLLNIDTKKEMAAQNVGSTQGEISLAAEMEKYFEGNNIPASELPVGQVIVGPIPKDARPISDLPANQKVSALYYSACRSALVTITFGKEKFEQLVKISDPRYFQSVGFPLKGKITMHSECGASVVSEKNTSVKSSIDLIDALVAQINVITAEKSKEE
ncbi:MAG: hypothetical protein V4732_21975 [Pseudomonadota bacterium]